MRNAFLYHTIMQRRLPREVAVHARRTIAFEGRFGMTKHFQISIIQVLAALTSAVDLSQSRFRDHAERTAFLAAALARELGWPKSQIKEVVIAALLHDIGMSSSGEKLQFTDIDPDPSVTFRHAHRGWELLREHPLFSSAAPIVLHHHDQPSGDLRAAARLIKVADRIDIMLDRHQYSLWQVDEIMAALKREKGTTFDSTMVDAAEGLSKKVAVWLDLETGTYRQALHSQFPEAEAMTLEQFESLAGLFAAVIDHKSPFTAGHSSGVAGTAYRLAAKLGWSEEQRRKLRIAGLLHDLGKMAVPDAILEKPGPLSKNERLTMLRHPYHTYHLLQSFGPRYMPLGCLSSREARRQRVSFWVDFSPVG